MKGWLVTIFFITIMVVAAMGDLFKVGTSVPTVGGHAVENVCVYGVTYYTSMHRLAVAYNTDGTLILCEEVRWEEK